MLMVILGNFLIGLGAAALAAITVYIVKLTIQALFSRIKNRIIQKHTRTVGTVEVRELLGGVVQEKLKKGQTISMAELEEKFGKKSVLFCDIDENGKVDADSIELEKTNERDKQIDDLLEANNGCVLISA